MPVFLPGGSQGWRSLVGCHLWGRKESDTTEATQQQQQQPPGNLPNPGTEPTSLTSFALAECSLPLAPPGEAIPCNKSLLRAKHVCVYINIYFYFYFCIYPIDVLCLETVVVSQYMGVIHSKMWYESVHHEVVTSLDSDARNENLDLNSVWVHL